MNLVHRAGFVVLFLVTAPLVRAQTALPSGNGKEIVESTCGTCHAISRVTSSGYDRAGWMNVVNMMVSDGAPLNKDQIATVADYLAKNFPAKAAPAAVVIPGAAQVTIKEWDVPTSGSRPHDPLATRDGSIWWTGQMANVLGKFNPSTGDFKEYHAKIADSGPRARRG